MYYAIVSVLCKGEKTFVLGPSDINNSTHNLAFILFSAYSNFGARKVDV